MSRTSLRWLSALLAIVLAILSCTFPPEAPSTVEYYVSVKGNDSTGNGTLAKPWRHIQYAIDHAAEPGAGLVVRINLLKGIYEENLVIKRPLIIQGAGVGVPSTNAGDPLTPIQEISLIQRKLLEIGPGILIQDATSVDLRDLVVYGGGLRVVNSRFIARNIEVQQSAGLYAIQIESSSLFYIEDSKIMTGTLISDYALDIMASSGDIQNTYMGDHFDHVVNISPLVLGAKFNPYNAFPKNHVRILDSQIAGSNVGWADGVRINGPIGVTIEGTTITRSHPDSFPADPDDYNKPHAGIDIRGYQFAGNHVIDVDGVTTSGFDVGIGFEMEGFDLTVQNSSIAGLRYDVHAMREDYQGAPVPVVDFGGGPHGSGGKNVFDAKPQYAFYNDAPYDMWACYNNWKVLNPQIDPLRIFDKLDVASKGRVKWNCSAANTPPPSPTKPPVIVTPTLTPSSTTVKVKKDDLCYEGPGSGYEVVSAVQSGQILDLLGQGEGGGYLVVVNPIYHDPCWLPMGSAEFEGDLNSLRIIPVPPQPTPTPTYGPGILDLP